MKIGEYEIPRFLDILEYDFMKGNSLLIVVNLCL